MNSDIRLAVSFRGHRKRKRLRGLLGPGSTDFLIDLWIGAAMTHPGGLLRGMDETDIALEAGWEDDPHTFVAALVECRFLEKTENGVYALHDWDDHQGYVVHAERRKAQARNAAWSRTRRLATRQRSCFLAARAEKPMREHDFKRFSSVMLGVVENYGQSLSPEGISIRFQALAGHDISEVERAAYRLR